MKKKQKRCVRYIQDERCANQLAPALRTIRETLALLGYIRSLAKAKPKPKHPFPKGGPAIVIGGRGAGKEVILREMAKKGIAIITLADMQGKDFKGGIESHSIAGPAIFQRIELLPGMGAGESKSFNWLNDPRLNKNFQIGYWNRR